MRLIDADELNKIKFHPLPYTHIVPADLLKCQTEAYERGWNDAIDAIIENAETIEERKTGHWIDETFSFSRPRCSVCGELCIGLHAFSYVLTDYCPNCGAHMVEAEHGGN